MVPRVRFRIVDRRPDPIAIGRLVVVLGFGVFLLGTSLAGASRPNAAGLPPGASIVSSADPVDAGLPFTVSARLWGGVGPYNDTWSDSDGETGWGSSWRIDALSPGNLTVYLRITDGDGLLATANRVLSVLRYPAVNLTTASTRGDVGLPLSVAITISGGLPPYTVNWSTPGTPAGANSTWGAPGTRSETVVYPRFGPAWFSVGVADALGAVVNRSAVVAEIVPGPSLTVSVTPPVTEVGSPVELRAIAQNGAIPLVWTVASSLPTLNATQGSGLLLADGEIWWNATFAVPGSALLNLTTFDAVGAMAIANASVDVLPPVGVNLTVPATAPGVGVTFAVRADIRGGAPPYAYRLELSDGELTSGNLSGPGLVPWWLAASQPGVYTLSVRITDGLGRTVTAESTVRIGGAVPTPAGPPSLLSIGVGVAVLGGLLAAGVLYFLRRRTGARRRPDRGEGSNAFPVLRRLAQDSELLDRETLLLLAEEEGFSPGQATEALSRLVRAGYVTIESGPGDEPTVRWIGSPDRSEPEGGGQS